MSYGLLNEDRCWYAIHTHPNQESRAESNLRAWHVETFLPLVRDTRFNDFTGKPTFFIKPLFPRYLFAKFAAGSLLHKIRYTRGVHSVVCIGEAPALIDDTVIEIIAAQVDHQGFVRIGEDLKPGARVLVQAGPFKGITGIFERETRDADRIKILLDSVCYQVRVEIEKRLVRPTTRPT